MSAAGVDTLMADAEAQVGFIEDSYQGTRMAKSVAAYTAGFEAGLALALAHPTDAGKLLAEIDRTVHALQNEQVLAERHRANAMYVHALRYHNERN